MQKHCVFVHFLNIRFRQEARKTTWKPLSISSKTTSKNDAILNEISIILGIDYPMRNFDLLGKLLASISASILAHLDPKSHSKTLFETTSKTPSKQHPKRNEIDPTWGRQEPVNLFSKGPESTSIRMHAI